MRSRSAATLLFISVAKNPLLTEGPPNGGPNSISVNLQRRVQWG